MPTYQNDPIVSRTNTETPEGFNFGVYGESTLFNGVRGVTKEKVSSLISFSAVNF